MAFKYRSLETDKERKKPGAVYANKDIESIIILSSRDTDVKAEKYARLDIAICIIIIIISFSS
jgi:hypothetical protein